MTSTKHKHQHLLVGINSRPSSFLLCIVHLTPTSMSFVIPAHMPPPSASGSDSSDSESDAGASDWASSLGDARRSTSLFDSSVHPSPELALAADKAAHGFDLKATSERLGLDIYGRMRLINLIRKEKLSAKDVDGVNKDDERLKDDALLVPVLADDPLLREFVRNCLQYSLVTDGPPRARL